MAMIKSRVRGVLLAMVAFVVLAEARPGRRENTGEATAISALRAINAAQASYSSSCAAGGYAVDLADLARAPRGSSQGFVSPNLNMNGVVKSGYIFRLAKDGAAGTIDVGSVARTCNGSQGQPASSYFASAVPKEAGDRPAGLRYFATDKRGTIYVSSSGPIPNPIPKDAAVLR